MKKINTIIGAGIISMAVALSPALAQMNSSTGSTPAPSGPSTAVQSSTGDKAQAPGAASRDEKNMPAKPGDVKRDGKDKDTAVPKSGNETKPETAPAKPGADVKAVTPPATQGSGVKSESKDKDTAGPKAGSETKPETAPAKPGADKKAVTPPATQGTGVKSESRDKDAASNPGADMKSGAASGKSEMGAKESKSKLTHHAKSDKSAVKAKTRHVSHKHAKVKDADAKSGSKTTVKPTTNN